MAIDFPFLMPSLFGFEVSIVLASETNGMLLPFLLAICCPENAYVMWKYFIPEMFGRIYL